MRLMLYSHIRTPASPASSRVFLFHETIKPNRDEAIIGTFRY